MVKIAIDGPSGGGKSTLAKRLAAHLGMVYVDTGALYRTIGYFVQSKGIGKHDNEKIIECLPNINIEIEYRDGTQHVILNGEDMGDKIRTPEISMYASAVSAIPEVRVFLLETQRSIARKNNVIMDGRDIGTVILPDADVKIFLFASNEERARRRCIELHEKGIDAKYEDVLSEMNERDKNDSSRAVAPAIPAPDAVMLDNSGFEPDDTFAAALNIIETTLKGKL